MIPVKGTPRLADEVGGQVGEPRTYADSEYESESLKLLPEKFTL